ncbi:protein CutA homolog isoform X2 [Neocloeon triangulifer]|uniref:protein CutA homolog isoform X2 n=1 Tax=Neocloeon triangulifer TaxID=2078957 RepID=UPI00286F7577|nr:protein CutA homolog isoform X2 [Neocloeon triangulifer]
MLCFLSTALTTTLLKIVPSASSTCTASTASSVMEFKHEPGTFSVAYVTAPNDTTAKKIARGLVENKLAACVNVIPQITSIYSWENKIEEDSEVLMMIKTRTSVVDELTKFVRENHPYKVCEVITLPIQGGNLPYLKWIDDEVKGKIEKC